MDEIERDWISKGFTDLAALPEDTTILGVEGQSGGQSLVSTETNIKQIWPILIDCIVALAVIERNIDEDPHNQIP